MTKQTAKVDLRWCLDVLLVVELHTSQIFDVILKKGIKSKTRTLVRPENKNVILKVGEIKIHWYEHVLQMGDSGI
jgi:hypothetical protein